VALVVGIVAAVIGFVVGIVFTEIVFANSSNWPDIVPFVLAVVGWLVARELFRRRHAGKTEHGMPSATR